MTMGHVARATKQMHPGEYDHLPDHVLGGLLKKKFPKVYGDMPDEDQSPKFRPVQNLDANTIPETPRTLAIQLDQLKQGIRRVVFIVRGSKVHPNQADFGARKLTLPSGEYYYKPDMIRPQEIIKAVANHELNEILGSATEGYGAPSKQNLQGEPQAVMSKDSTGETVQGALTDPEHEQQAIHAAQDVTPPGGSVSVEHPAKEIANRLMAAKKFKGRVNGKWPKPGRNI